ncbi:MAG: hypothetical protein JF615_01000 [Asticcacaulis sp.]|nr:hypothetical protein [Asticcacaulis sp.]
MSSTNSTLEAFDPPAKPNALPFVALIVVALAIGAAALWQGHAPLDPYPTDWVNWARIEPTWAGVFACGFTLFVIGLIGTIRGMMPAGAPKPRATKLQPRKAVEPVAAVVAPAASVDADDHLAVPSLEGLTVAASRPAEARGSLKFDAHRLNAERADPMDEATTTPRIPF